MSAYDDFAISVNRDWRDWHSASVRLADLQDVHWRAPAGTAQSMLHGYVCCTESIRDEMPHDCDPAAGHRLLVCILKSHTLQTAYAELARRAQGQPMRRLTIRLF